MNTNKDFYVELERNLIASHTILPYAKNPEFHFHNSYELQLYVSGSAEYYIEQYHYLPKPGTLFILNDQDLHKVINPSGADYERYTIHFPSAIISPFLVSTPSLLACFQHSSNTPANIILLTESEKAAFISLCEALINTLHNPSEYKDALSISYLIQILVLANQSVGSTHYVKNSDSFLNRIIDYVNLHIEDDISLDTLSKHLSLDKYYISHQFKAKTGSSLYRYILIKKISYAKRLLEQGESVMAVCFKTGFNDYNNFIRTFKKHTGISPGNYQKQFSRY